MGSSASTHVSSQPTVGNTDYALVGVFNSTSSKRNAIAATSDEFSLPLYAFAFGPGYNVRWHLPEIGLACFMCAV